MLPKEKSNEVITDLFQHYIHNDKAIDTFKKRKLDGESVASKINSSKRLTAGVLFNAGHVRCDEEVLKLVEKKCKDRNTAASNRALKVFNSYLEKKIIVDDLRSKGVLDVQLSKQKTKD